MFTHVNPVSNIFFTPSQNRKNKELAKHPPEGNWAIGNRKPLSPRKTNCSTWVARTISSFLPVEKMELKNSL